MQNDDDQSMEDDAVIPDPDPTAIMVINEWLDVATNFGTNEIVVRDVEFTAGGLAEFAGVPTMPTASNMLQSYRHYNYWMDERCSYVIAHEGRYGAGAPWRIQSTTHPVPETTRRVYRFNAIRHLSWEFYDHSKKEAKSFGAEMRQALVQLDSTTGSAAAQTSAPGHPRLRPEPAADHAASRRRHVPRPSSTRSTSPRRCATST